MIVTLLIFIVILGFLVFIHEFGHFLAAKRAGIKVEEFGFGFPPRIFGIEIKGTIYSINWIPIGGFVKIKGESGEHRKDKDSFAAQKIWKRGIILSSGVGMNFLLTILLLIIGFSIGIPSVIDQKISSRAKIRDLKIQIFSVVEGLPAEEAGLQMGDTIVKIDDQKFTAIEELQAYNQTLESDSVQLEIDRGGQILTKEVGLVEIEENGQEKKAIGVNLVETGIVSYPWYQAIVRGIEATLFITWQIILAIVNILKNLVVSQQLAADISGPVGIAVLTGQVANLGFVYILQFAALLSLNFAIINFLPFPALDGGRLLFLIIEKIRGKAVNANLESIIHNIGFALIILLLLTVTFRDITRFKEDIIGLFKGLSNL